MTLGHPKRRLNFFLRPRWSFTENRAPKLPETQLWGDSMSGPYENVPESDWLRVTDQLLAEHPLKLSDILAISQHAWSSLWSTRIGTGSDAIDLRHLPMPATVVGYFFEKLFAKRLSDITDGQWRSGHGGEKDLVCEQNPAHSIEIKASGQLGLKIFGNRSYGQELQAGSIGKKEKSGYYITVNFYGMTMCLIRFGWIDAGDWKPQLAPTGQMAGLEQAVYDSKLIPIKGDYTLAGPAQLLNGVGAKKAESLRDQGIITIKQILDLGHGLNDSKTLNAARLFKATYAE